MNNDYICENPLCGKKHDGSFGTGRFCNKHCWRQYCGIKGKEKLLSLDYNKKHQKGKTQDHSKQRAPYGRWKCECCNIIFNTRAELYQHNKEWHKSVSNDGPWNKGLTKNDDARVAKYSENAQKTYKKRILEGYKNPTWINEYWTEERRKKASNSKILLYSENPEKHPNRKLANNRNKMTYPESVAYDWLVENNVEFEHQKMLVINNKKRFVDFYLAPNNLIIEIDGEYWHKDKNYDKNKDLMAENNGYKTLRISAKDKIIDVLEKYFNK